MQSEGGLETTFKSHVQPRFRGRVVQGIEFEMIIEGNKAHTNGTIERHFGDGSADKFCSVDLVKEDGVWKISK